MRLRHYVLKLGALQLLQQMSREIEETAPGELPGIRILLDSFSNDDIILNTAVVEALSAYGFIEPFVASDDAVSEMRAVLAPDAARDSGELALLTDVSPEQFLCDQAYGLLSKIFEDVFQGAYYDAYCSLTPNEKRNILCLAAKSKLGFFTDWILRELLQLGDREALPAFERFAVIPVADSFSSQEAVSTFVLGLKGCARYGGCLPTCKGEPSADIMAWQAIGVILFHCLRDVPAPDAVWDRFTGDVTLAAADAFYQLHHSRHLMSAEEKALDLVAFFPERFRALFEECLHRRDRLSSLFQCGGSRDGGVTRYLITCLAEIGNAGSISILRILVDDSEFGKDGIAAIEKIQKRERHARRSAS